jgi:hypothetical protein
MRGDELARRVRELSAVGLLVLAMMVAASASALAGSNGQQINVQDDRGVVYSACVDGTNQSGSHVRVCFSTPSYNNWLNNYWWIGWTYIDEYNSSGGYIGSVSTYVPKSQQYDWWCVHTSGNWSGSCF